MIDDDLWRWFAYEHAWHRIFQQHDGKSPRDPDGMWFDTEMVASAERLYRGIKRRHGRMHHEPVSAITVRDDFDGAPGVPVRHWTKAELALKMREYRDNAESLGISEFELAKRHLAAAFHHTAVAQTKPLPPMTPSSAERGQELCDQLKTRQRRPF